MLPTIDPIDGGTHFSTQPVGSGDGFFGQVGDVAKDVIGDFGNALGNASSDLVAKWFDLSGGSSSGGAPPAAPQPQPAVITDGARSGLDLVTLLGFGALGVSVLYMTMKK